MSLKKLVFCTLLASLVLSNQSSFAMKDTPQSGASTSMQWVTENGPLLAICAGAVAVISLIVHDAYSQEESNRINKPVMIDLSAKSAKAEPNHKDRKLAEQIEANEKEYLALLEKQGK